MPTPIPTPAPFFKTTQNKNNINKTKKMNEQVRKWFASTRKCTLLANKKENKLIISGKYVDGFTYTETVRLLDSEELMDMATTDTGIKIQSSSSTILWNSIRQYGSLELLYRRVKCESKVRESERKPVVNIDKLLVTLANHNTADDSIIFASRSYTVNIKSIINVDFISEKELLFQISKELDLDHQHAKIAPIDEDDEMFYSVHRQDSKGNYLVTDFRTNKTHEVIVLISSDDFIRKKI